MNKQSRIAQAAAPIVPANNGAAATPHGTPLANQRAEGEAGGRSPVPSVSPTYPCRHCEGAGEAEYMGLTEDRYHCRTCHVCEGTGQEAPYCAVCQFLKETGRCDDPSVSFNFWRSRNDWQPHEFDDLINQAALDSWEFRGNGERDWTFGGFAKRLESALS